MVRRTRISHPLEIVEKNPLLSQSALIEPSCFCVSSFQEENAKKRKIHLPKAVRPEVEDYECPRRRKQLASTN